MNTKSDQPKATNLQDIGKLILAAAIVAAGIFAYSWFGDDASVPATVRVAGLLVTFAAAVTIAAFTAPGRRMRGFVAETQFEMRKVVWPTRDETLKTTGIIILVVIVLSLLLGLIDLILKAVILDWLLKLGS
ncbi:MAG: preprotein translocase subunit SecE [Rhodanobacter sp.]